MLRKEKAVKKDNSMFQQERSLAKSDYYADNQKERWLLLGFQRAI